MEILNLCQKGAMHVEIKHLAFLLHLLFRSLGNLTLFYFSFFILSGYPYRGKGLTG